MTADYHDEATPSTRVFDNGDKVTREAMMTRKLDLTDSVVFTADIFAVLLARADGIIEITGQELAAVRNNGVRLTRYDSLTRDSIIYTLEPEST